MVSMMNMVSDFSEKKVETAGSTEAAVEEQMDRIFTLTLTLSRAVHISPAGSSQHPPTPNCLQALCPSLVSLCHLRSEPSTLLHFAEELLLGRAVSLHHRSF